MSNFCTNCGNALNGKTVCDRCGKEARKIAVNDIVDKVKNYDYHAMADELKEKAADIADKAKSYDYKSKAEAVRETIANYDYKEKVKEAGEAVKNFDYENKAREISENFRNYDYRGEAENIKNGGLRYFWDKHKKLSVAIIILILAVVIFPKLNKNNIVNDGNEMYVNTGGAGSVATEYKTNLSDQEITNISIMTFEANYMSASSPTFVGSEIIGQDKYGRCAAILEYDLGGIKGKRKFYVFADGLKKDGTVATRNGIVEESMNNSQLSESTIKIRKEQFGWDTPR